MSEAQPGSDESDVTLHPPAFNRCQTLLGSMKEAAQAGKCRFSLQWSRDWRVLEWGHGSPVLSGQGRFMCTIGIGLLPLELGSEVGLQRDTCLHEADRASLGHKAQETNVGEDGHPVFRRRSSKS